MNNNYVYISRKEYYELVIAKKKLGLIEASGKRLNYLDKPTYSAYCEVKKATILNDK